MLFSESGAQTLADDSEKKPGLIQRAVRGATGLVKSVAKEVAQLDFFARFKGDNGGSPIDFPIDVGRDTIWATQQQMADLFGVNQPAIAKHVKNIFDNNELPDDETTHSKMELVRLEGGRDVAREVSHYSLDVIFTVGYRVNGSRAAEFRQWANRVLRGYVEDGFAINGARLRSDPDALQRLTDEVRAIRTSEKALYQRVRETFAACAIDYDSSSDEARRFFAYSQDAFHYAVSEHTAAQIIIDRADAKLPNMGMLNLGNKAPTLVDARIAKNYMTAEELRSLELLGEAWLLYAESITHRGMRVSMSRLLNKINELIVVNEYTAFPGYDKIKSSRQLADQHAKKQLEHYRKLQINS